MTRDDARSALAGLVSATSTPTLSDAELDVALDAARVVDADGLGPVDDGYTDTFDLDYAAAEAFDLKAVKAASTAQVRKFSAEGATFERDLPDFAGLAATYRARSSAGASTGIGVIELDPQTPEWMQPRSTRPC